MRNQNMQLGLLLFGIGFVILYGNNHIAIYLTNLYASNQDVTALKEVQIIANYANMLLVIGGILFYKGVHIITKYIFCKDTETNHNHA